MEPGKRPLLIAVLTSTLLTGLDLTIVATATPLVVRDLGGADLYGGVASAYFMGSGILMPIAGRAAEVFPIKRVFMLSLATFMVASIMCAMATSMPILIAARALQGAGGGAMFAVGGGLVGLLFSPKEQAVIYEYKSLAYAVATVSGPMLGGWISEHASWRLVFLINPPMAAVALAIIARRVPDLRPVAADRFDWTGAFGLATWSLLLLFIFTWGGSKWPWTSPQIIVVSILCVATAIVFWRREARNDAPLFDLALLSDRVFRYASLAFWCVGGFFMGTVIYLPLFLTVLRGMSATEAGSTLTPIILGTTAGAILAGQLAARYSRCKPFLVPAAVACVGLLVGLLEVMQREAAMLWLTLLLGAFGAAIGVVLVLIPLSVQATVAAERQGTAAGSIQFFQQLGSTMATALMGTLLANASGGAMASSEGMGIVLVCEIALAVGCLAAILLLPDVRLRARALVSESALERNQEKETPALATE